MGLVRNDYQRMVSALQFITKCGDEVSRSIHSVLRDDMCQPLDTHLNHIVFDR